MAKMSEDGFSDCFDEPNMEIQIKTLMGTTFDIKVAHTDTVGDIKKKIFRVEGIPIHQQNLIFKSNELKDTHRLCDAGITNGSIVTLVSAMRGGPISTRRLSIACEHHVILKELKELLENTRDEIGDKLAPGSKVSVLVFKEGDIINLLRVIENEDGSYSPYSEKPISPPMKPSRRETRLNIFERLVEDSDMSMKIANLRKKMQDVSIRRRKSKEAAKEATEEGAVATGQDFQFLNDIEVASTSASSANSSLNNTNDWLVCIDKGLKILERNMEEENHEEIALKEKHRTRRFPRSKYSENRGLYSHTKQYHARLNRAMKSSSQDEKSSDEETVEQKSENSVVINNELDLQMPGCNQSFVDSYLSSAPIDKMINEKVDGGSGDGNYFNNFTNFEEPPDLVSLRNRLHLTRLVLDERPKSSTDSLELEEAAQDLWEIHESATERLKHSATCKVGLLRRQSMDFYEEAANKPATNLNFNSEFEVCSSGKLYHMPQFISSSPSAIPPQYAPKETSNYFYTRSPLYGRKVATTEEKLSEDKEKNENLFLGECSSIQRLKNDCLDENLFTNLDDTVEDLYGYYNFGCSELTATDASSSKLLPILNSNNNCSESNQNSTKLPVLAPVITKKKARCNECNKRLNITNIYDCRCGKIFCSQHRYSEAHCCTYDYKTEGRRLLQQQNPLVQAEKVNKI